MGTTAKQQAYLQALAEVGTTAIAARRSGCTVRSVGHWRNQPGFVDLESEAIDTWRGQIVVETVERAKTSDPLQAQVFKFATGQTNGTVVNVHSTAIAGAQANAGPMDPERVAGALSDWAFRQGMVLAGAGYLDALEAAVPADLLADLRAKHGHAPQPALEMVEIVDDDEPAAPDPADFL